MTRRTAIHALAGVAGAPATLSAQGQTRRPNILFLMTDQHRFDCLGCSGNTAIATPNLDRIAREGIRFASAYSSTPTCTPARAGLLTGMSPWGHGMLGYHRVAERYPHEMPRLLGDAGYRTMGIGKMHWHPQRNMHGFHSILLDESGRVQSPEFKSDYRSWFASVAPNLNPDATDIGWNSYRAGEYKLPEELHPTRWTGDCAVRFLSTYERPEPFFLKVSFARPHSPYDPPARLMKRYQDAPIPKRAVGNWAAKYTERNTPEDTLWHGDLGEETARYSRQGYYGSVSFIDEQIGRILEALEKRGWLEETLIVFTSDHGDMTGDHHLWRKSYAYESSAHIPMLLRWPRGLVSESRGRVMPQPVEIRDILPTFLDAAGATIPEAIEGRSMLALAKGNTAGWREWIDLEHDVCYSKANHWNALCDGRWKYIYHAQDGSEQLFDLKADPGELADLSGDQASAAELRKWRGRMVEHLSVRGNDWVRAGNLVPRPESILRSPNYPSASANG